MVGTVKDCIRHFLCKVIALGIGVIVTQIGNLRGEQLELRG